MGTHPSILKKRRRMSREGKEVFDPVEEHRPHCLYVVTTSFPDVGEAAEELKPGWKCVLEAMQKEESMDAFVADIVVDDMSAKSKVTFMTLP